MPTNRNHLQCDVCGTKTITRVSLVYGPYREFAFACAGCGIEIRLGVNVIAPSEEEIKTWSARYGLPEEAVPPHAEYPKLLNATWIRGGPNDPTWLEEDQSIQNVEILDDEFLVSVPKERKALLFLQAVDQMGLGAKDFQKMDRIRRGTAAEVWPELERLILHHDREQWDLFDKQFQRIFQTAPPEDTDKKSFALDLGLENYGLLFCKDDSGQRTVRDHLERAWQKSPDQMWVLVDYFRSQGRDRAIESQINAIRDEWSKLFSALAALYTTHYWDASKYQLEKFTLAQKRFEDLKGLYVDCFETFCRIAVIAAGVEGIISLGRPIIPKAKGEMTLAEFDVFRNGSKPDVLRRLGPPISDLFVPYMDHKLRNGIGHNSARYDVVSDQVHYVLENERGRKSYQIPYIRFCYKLFELYPQLEVVALYVNWLRRFTEEVE